MKKGIVAAVSAAVIVASVIGNSTDTVNVKHKEWEDGSYSLSIYNNSGIGHEEWGETAVYRQSTYLDRRNFFTPESCSHGMCCTAHS